MKRGDIIRYVDMTLEEGMNLQRGMNFSVRGRGYHIILMSVRKNAPYADEWLNDGRTIIYEGHDIQKNHNLKNLQTNQVDQPMYTPNNTLTENGKFYEAVQRYKKNKINPDIVKVYEKIKDGIWVYNGFFQLIDANIKLSNGRKVFKFILNMIDEEYQGNKFINVLEIEHNRLIPTNVKQQVYARDKGKCIKCNSNVNLHYDHIIPFSKGGSSIDANNIQLLCQKCNLKKKDKIE